MVNLPVPLTSLVATSAKVSSIFLHTAGFNFIGKVINLGLPFSNNFVKVSASLLSDDGSSMDSLILQLDVFQLSFKSMFGLFSACNLLVQAFNGLFSLSKTSSQLSSVAFQFINATKSLSLKLGFPELDLCLSLRQSLQTIRLLFRFFFNSVSQVFKLTVQVLEPSQERCTIPRFRISKSLGIFQLSGKRYFSLAKGSNSILCLINLSGQILILNLKLFP